MNIMILGANGYLGWSLVLRLSSTTDHQIIAVDNYTKIRLQSRLGIEGLYPHLTMIDKLKLYTDLTGKNNIITCCASVDKYETMEFLISSYKPDVILNCAQQPSAPYSQMSPENAAFTLTNNMMTCMNCSWAVSKINPEILIIQIGSMGVYQDIDTAFIPRNKVDLSYGSDTVKNSWLPMLATDVYHQSKVNTFGASDMFTKMWGLRTITIQQSTIFGVCECDLIASEPLLYPQFNYDHIFGTVLNRFVCQAVSGSPITVYGDGTEKTCMISICSAVDRIINSLSHPVERGQHIVEHNYSVITSVGDLAVSVAEQTESVIENIDHPRKRFSPGGITHDYEVPTTGLDSSETDLKHHITKTLEFVKARKDFINKTHLPPTVKWSVE